MGLVAIAGRRRAFSLACTPGTTLNMRINGGSHYTRQRNLQRVGGTELIGYRLYSDAGLTPANAIPVGQDVSLSYSDANHIVLPVYGALQLSGMSPSGNLYRYPDGDAVMVVCAVCRLGGGE